MDGLAAPRMAPNAVKHHDGRNPGAHARRARYAPSHPLQLHRILSPLPRGGDGPCFRRTASGAWITMRTPLGPATLRLEQDAHGVEATAWGEGAAWALDGVPELLGRRDD